jgi:S1-C subfamily serine protease
VRAWQIFVVLDVAVVAAAGAAFLTLHHEGPRTVRTGVVLVDANLGGGNRTEGTGIVLTSGGEVLTNNHVIEGAKSVRVTVPATGKTYDADILGYDVAVDAALLRLGHAHGLRTASTAPATLHVGQRVLAVGGSSGAIRYTVGHVTGLRKTVTAEEERLRGLIEFDASVDPGDSGGPLLDLRGDVVGMDTAGRSRPGFLSLLEKQHDSYAIPLAAVLAVARAVHEGRGSPTLHVGPTAYLGVEIDPRSVRSGALVADVLPGSPAERAGMGPGARITWVDGRRVASPEQIVAVLLAKRPGDRLGLAWKDRGGSHRATIALVRGPAL